MIPDGQTQLLILYQTQLSGIDAGTSVGILQLLVFEYLIS